jgi:hypothetical protein
MTASVGREVDANLLPGAAPGSAQARANPQDAGGQDLGDRVETLDRRHLVGRQSVCAFHVLSGLDRRCRYGPKAT